MKKTWNEFWGEFLMVEFHNENPQRWSIREKRARWLKELSGLSNGATILNLGCGDGLLDICLGRLGMKVTGVDRLERVLSLARKEVADEDVTFITSDLKTLSMESKSYDAIMILEVLGLMSKEEDNRMIANASKWMKSHGVLIADCPRSLKNNEITNQWEFSQGLLTFHMTYDPVRQIQTIVPKFEKKDGTCIELYDPYDTDQKDGSGIQRYIYPPSELEAIFRMNGLAPETTDHLTSPDHYVMIGRK